MRYTFRVSNETLLSDAKLPIIRIKASRIYYNAVPIDVLIERKYTDASGYQLYVYLKPTLRPMDVKMEIHFMTCFLNENGNPCQKQSIECVYEPGSNYLGTFLYQYWLVSDVISKYGREGHITIAVDIKTCKSSINTDIMLQEIYATLRPESVGLLHDQIKAMEKELDETRARLDETRTLLEALSREPEKTVKAQKAPQAQEAPQAREAQEAPQAQEAHKGPKDIDLSCLSKDELGTLQTRIVEALRRLNECKVCLERAHNVAINPCGHQVCQTCLDILVKAHNACPICRGPIVSQIRLY